MKALSRWKTLRDPVSRERCPPQSWKETLARLARLKNTSLALHDLFSFIYATGSRSGELYHITFTCPSCKKEYLAERKRLPCTSCGAPAKPLTWKEYGVRNDEIRLVEVNGKKYIEIKMPVLKNPARRVKMPIVSVSREPLLAAAIWRVKKGLYGRDGFSFKPPRSLFWGTQKRMWRRHYKQFFALTEHESLHCLRHLRATHLCEEPFNFNPRQLQEYLGWADEAMALHYVHMRRGDLYHKMG